MAKTVSFFRGRLRVEKPIFPSLSFFLTELPLQGYHTYREGRLIPTVWLGIERPG